MRTAPAKSSLPFRRASTLFRTGARSASERPPSRTLLVPERRTANACVAAHLGFLQPDRVRTNLDASGGSVFRNLLGAGKGALIRAAGVNSTVGYASDVRNQKLWLPTFQLFFAIITLAAMKLLVYLGFL